MTGYLSQNPRTEEILASYPIISQSELDEAVRKASTAQREWRKMSLDARAKVLSQVGTKLEEDADLFATLMESEMGKLKEEGLQEARKCAALCHYTAENLKETLKLNSLKIDHAVVSIRHDPLGVILAVMPWNFPFWQFFRAAVPSLLSGNVLLLKHALNTPQCALAIEALFTETLPSIPIVQNLFIDHDQIKTLISNPVVRGVTLTGSKRAGVAVASAAAEVVKPCVLELGGSDPFIVFADADLEKAAQTAVTSRCINNGESCIAAKRFLVEDSIQEKFLELMTELMTQKVIGPLATKSQQQLVDDQVADAILKRARVHCGGAITTSKGYFYPPTVLSNIDDSMRVAHEEVFGPVATVIPFSSDDEALQIANKSDFGLGATVFTVNPKRIERFVEELECGLVFVNDMVRSDQRVPFGGVKESGYGRELGPNAALSFTNEKTVWVGENNVSK